MKKYLIVCFLLGIFLINASTIHAKENISGNLKQKTEQKKKVKVEVLFNSNGEDFIKEVTFDDGTKVKDYDYTITYLNTSANNVIVPNYSYPIAQYFDYAAWIVRDGVVSLSVDPNDSVRSEREIKDIAWNVLSSPVYGFGGDSAWRNTQVMKWQFDCHFQFANYKDTWNIEPSRTANSYLAVVLAGCNP